MNRTGVPWPAGTAALTVSQLAASNAGSLTGSAYARKPSSFSRVAWPASCYQASSLLKSVRTRSDSSLFGGIGTWEV